MEKKIYIVTSGEYSDYTIERVFSTKEKANEFIQQHGTDYRIEEYVVDEEKVKKEEKIWDVEIDIDDNSVIQSIPRNFLCREEGTCEYHEYFWNDVVDLCVKADSMDKAIKIAKERYFAIKSNDYIWSTLTKRENINKVFFNIHTNEFIKPDTL